MILRYTDRSKNDLDLAFAWYEKQRTGLFLEYFTTKAWGVYRIYLFVFLTGALGHCRQVDCYDFIGT